MALYMLYRNKSKTGGLDDLRKEFEGVYEKYNVNIIGFWENADDPNEVYYITRYEDEADYKTKVQQLRADARYAELTEHLKEVRADFQAVKLNPLWLPE
ncbi:MAG: NIPSNAP family protein [Candidatus Thorarchaeota archaeon]